MAKFFKYTLGSLLVLIIGLVGFWFLGRSYLEAQLKERVVNIAKQNTKDFKLLGVKINGFYPFKVSLSELQFKVSGIDNLHLKKMNAEINLLYPPWVSKNKLKLKIQVEGLALDIPLPEVSPQNLEKPKDSKNATVFELPKLPLPFPLELQAFINDSKITIWNQDKTPNIEIDNLNFGFEQTEVLNPLKPIKIDFKADFKTKWGGVDYKIPMQISTSEALFNGESVSAKNVNLNVSGLNLMFKEGNSNFVKNTHEWNTQFEIPDLSKLPTLPDFLPTGKWFGAINGKVQFRKTGEYPPYIGVSFSTSQLKGLMQVKNESTLVEGEVLATIKTQFVYYNKFKLDSLIAQLDLTNSEIKYKNLFTKPKGVTLNSDIDVVFANEKLQINKFLSNFHTANLNVSGSLNSANTETTQITIALNETQLSGYEKFSPLLEKMPLTGVLSLKGNINGDISDIKKVNIDLSQLNLKNISGFLEYASLDKKVNVEGGFQVNATGSLSYSNFELNRSNLDINFNGDQLKIVVPELLNKKAGQIFKLSTKFKNEKNEFKFVNLNFKIPGLQTILNGSVLLPQEGDKMGYNLTFDFKELKKSELQKVVPRLSEIEWDANILGKLNFSGKYTPTLDWTTQPLKVTGDAIVSIPFFKLSSPVKSNDEKPIDPSAPPPAPLLPNWPVFNDSDFFIKVHIDKFNYDTFEFYDFKLGSFYKMGNLSLSGQIDKFYDGTVEISSLNLNLLKPLPETIFSFKSKNINMEKFFNGNFENFKDAVSGTLNMSSRGRFPYPHGETWKNNIMAKGDVFLNQGRIKSLKIDELAGDVLAKIPGLGSEKNIETPEVALSLKTNYSITKGRVLLKNFDLITQDNNQLTCEGYFDLDLNCNLEGKIYLVKPPVRGSVYIANKDNKNRFVAPITIRGNLLSPSFSFARETIDELLARALRYETQQVQVKAKKELQNEYIKEQEKLKEKLKSKVKNIFGK
jgi:hypothetical protein